MDARMILIGGLALAAAATALAAPTGDMVGVVRTYVASEADTLPDLALANGLGYVEIAAANPGIDPWLPGEGTRIILPTGHLLPAGPRRGIVINLADQRLYFFPPGKPVQTYAIGVPSPGMNLQTGTTRVVGKRIKPVWIPPPSVRAEDPDLPLAVLPGPDNPLGEFALDLEWTSVVIHGTNRPYGIGRRVSHGCFRLYPDDIEALFKQVSVGTAVTVVDQQFKSGWIDGELYLEVHPTLEQADEIEERGVFTPAPVVGLDRYVFAVAAPLEERIDWSAVDRVARERTGIPMPVFKPETVTRAPWSK